MAKEFKCKTCGASGFPSLGQLRKHYADAGHPKKYTRRKKGATVVALPAPEGDAELRCMQECVRAIDAAAENLSWPDIRRIVAYLDARYTPPAEPVDETEYAIAS